MNRWIFNSGLIALWLSKHRRQSKIWPYTFGGLAPKPLIPAAYDHFYPEQWKESFVYPAFHRPHSISPFAFQYTFCPIWFIQRSDNELIQLPPFREFPYVRLLMFVCWLLVKKITVCLQWIYSVSQKIPPEGFWYFSFFFTNGWEFLIDFLHTYYTFPSTLDYKFCIQLSPILTKLCHIKRDYPVHKMSAIGRNACVDTFA